MQAELDAMLSAKMTNAPNAARAGQAELQVTEAHPHTFS